MTSGELTYDRLGVSLPEIYEQMGYGTAVPDPATSAEIDGVIGEIRRFLRPRYEFFALRGLLDGDRLTLGEKTFEIGRIISRQLRGAEAYSLFVATAGDEFEQYQQRLMKEGDMVRVFIADAVGSVIAEKTADFMETKLQEQIDKLGWKHTNRFSPGYCGWHVREQQNLFSLFSDERPCGIRLTPSSLMIPIKSVSGVIGLGPSVRKLEYSCGLCDKKDCYKRRLKPKNKLLNTK